MYLPQNEKGISQVAVAVLIALALIIGLVLMNQSRRSSDTPDYSDPARYME